MASQFEIIDNELIIYLDSSLYSKDSIFKCVYWYTAKYNTEISFHNPTTFKVALKSITNVPIPFDDLRKLQIKLQRDLIDFNLRDIVTKETQNIRDLLIAKAFSNGEFDESPPGELSDPVGFDVNQLKND